MDSPSFDSPRPTLLPRRESDGGDVSQTIHRVGRATSAGSVVIAGFGDSVAADYAAFVGRNAPGAVRSSPTKILAGLPIRQFARYRRKDLVRSTPDLGTELGRADSVIVFVTARLAATQRRALDEFVEIARGWRPRFVGIISTFRIHLDDPDAREVEDDLLARFKDRCDRLVVFRPGHLLSQRASVSRFLRRFAPFYPLVPQWFSTCFVEGSEFFAAVETERLNDTAWSGADGRIPGADGAAISSPPGRLVGDRNRFYTMLGANLSCHEVLFRHRVPGVRDDMITAISSILSWLLVGHAVAWILTLLARRFPSLRPLNVQTLKPRSMRDLVALCHRRNIGHVKVVGYNNGVNHFGHRHPGKTVVSTIHCRRLRSAGTRLLKADCGATVRGALDFLATNNQELYVVPNYSYVSLGTAFFVPIHGSAVDYSTVADTISRVVLYDPDSDRIISAERDDPAFREHVYDQQSRIVVLRLYILAKPKSKYFVHRETLENASSADLLAALRDPDSTNVEIRQSGSASTKVTVAKYYNDLGETSAPALELPRDTLGRLWDRLEENPVTSYLMHALSRHVAWHTELFFTPSEFDVFWRTHHQVPLRKIQLRYLRRDGLPHSPCRDEDCVSSDMFIFRWSKSRLLEYLKNTFTIVRTNPGKHSH